MNYIIKHTLIVKLLHYGCTCAFNTECTQVQYKTSDVMTNKVRDKITNFIQGYRPRNDIHGAVHLIFHPYENSSDQL